MRILIYSYNYHPEPIGIAPLMTELAEGLVKRGHEVRVITAMPNYPERRIYEDYRGKLFSTTQQNGVKVQRCFVWVKPRPSLVDRLLLDGSFVVTSFIQALNGWRPDVILTTVPPLPVCVPATLLSWLYRAPVVLSLQDILPEAAVQVGLLTNKTMIRVFEALERFAYRSATAVSVISEGFVDNLIGKQVPEQKITLIPNWVDVNFIRPLPQEESRFRQTYNLENKFVVMYSGNIALTQGLKTVIRAAARLTHKPEIAFVIVGEGKALAELQRLCEEFKAENVLLLPFQPREQLPEMLAAADVGLIVQKRNVVSFNMPSKTQVLLASGRAIIASVPLMGEAARAVRRSRGGIVIPPEDPAALAEAVLLLQNNPMRLAELAREGREFAVNTYSFEQALSRYEALLTRVAAGEKATTEVVPSASTTITNLELPSIEPSHAELPIERSEWVPKFLSATQESSDS
ncbi:glycosyltransferase family 4 protein [Leptolyngbya sp. FACHB-261]|uniref:glycosyltransferase family 4 protein n=1 Tax=Leptolyngbya sp. FACHB-261 TaxID=2692806 RepID=UPI001683D982|nr:glycosyltransferase family 4 protein [Leptolyngbya sp. FACHB-261]MBD2103407.1 glycosyltransferase family 4 protein [Leptolyngbya sp. FACHB-261]